VARWKYTTSGVTMKEKKFVWSLIILEVLFVLCAMSVMFYRYLGEYDFAYLGYRTFNIVFSILFIFYLIYGLLKAHKNILSLVLVFSLFHFVEGIIITFWYKVVIHFFILVWVGWYYYKKKTLGWR